MTAVGVCLLSGQWCLWNSILQPNQRTILHMIIIITTTVRYVIVSCSCTSLICTAKFPAEIWHLLYGESEILEIFEIISHTRCGRKFVWMGPRSDLWTEFCKVTFKLNVHLLPRLFFSHLLSPHCQTSFRDQKILLCLHVMEKLCHFSRHGQCEI